MKTYYLAGLGLNAFSGGMCVILFCTFNPFLTIGSLILLTLNTFVCARLWEELTETQPNDPTSHPH